MITLILCWLFCGVLAHGFQLAYFQREYPRFAFRDRWRDRVCGLMSILIGPGALIAYGFFQIGRPFHGFKLW